MNPFKRNLLIGAVLTVAMFAVMAWDADDSVSQSVKVPPTQMELDVQKAQKVAEFEMDQATGLCIKTAMGKGLDPEQYCDMVEP